MKGVFNMKWFQNFMRGRYGVDQLSFAILVLYFIVTMIGLIIQNSMITYLSTILILWSWFRILSRKTQKRSAENTLYLQKTYPIRMWFRKKKNRFQDRKTHKYYKCPSCKQELRVPKGKGEITITCPKCHTKFDKRT